MQKHVSWKEEKQALLNICGGESQSDLPGMPYALGHCAEVVECRVSSTETILLNNGMVFNLQELRGAGG